MNARRLAAATESSLALAMALAVSVALALAPARAAADDAGPAGARIVSLGAAVTETLAALGIGSRIVGVDVTSELGDAASRVARVGYIRTLGAEGILSLRPTSVLASAEAGPPAVFDQLRSAGVRVEILDVEASAAGATHLIHALGRLTRTETRAKEIAETLDREIEEASRTVAELGASPRVLFVVHPPRTGSPLAAGRGTPADAMIALAGGLNVAADFEGYRPLTPEAAALSRPDVLLVPAGTTAKAGGSAALLEAAGLARTPAAAKRAIVEIEASALAFGPSTGRSVADLARRLRAAGDASTDSR